MTAKSIEIQRRVAWIDTDAAGIWHHSLALRWFEEAEAELHRGLGTTNQTFGATPRVRTEFSFDAPLRFDDLVDITFSVVELGETSVTYALEIEHGSRHIASGRMVAVFIDRATGEKMPWTDELREALRP